MIRCQIFLSFVPNDVRGGARANRPLGVADGLGELHLLAVFEHRRRVPDNLRIQCIGHGIALL